MLFRSIRDGKIAKIVDAKLSGQLDGPKFIVSAEGGTRNVENGTADITGVA